MKTVPVKLGDRSYSVFIGPRARHLLQKCITTRDPKPQVAIIADQTVAQFHVKRLMEGLSAEPAVLTFPPGENSKSLTTVENLCERLADARVDRNSVLVAFGGGVAGDIAGFVAAVWLRGVRYVQVPTTLLAAVDASVGGKTGVNLRAGKNLVGAFHQPLAVLVDTEFLGTLPPREFRSGLAESIKHAAIRDPGFLAWHEQNVDRVLAQEPGALTELIARNCAIKADVVSRDEREAGLRAILNYGHTIGHALEHLLDYELRHGECVALGMLVENELARMRGWLEPSDAERLRDLLVRCGLPSALPRALGADEIWAACQVDKKVRSAAVNFVLLRSLGEPVRVDDVPFEQVRAALRVIQPA